MYDIIPTMRLQSDSSSAEIFRQLDFELRELQLRSDRGKGVPNTGALGREEVKKHGI